MSHLSYRHLSDSELLQEFYETLQGIDAELLSKVFSRTLPEDFVRAERIIYISSENLEEQFRKESEERRKKHQEFMKESEERQKENMKKHQEFMKKCEEEMKIHQENMKKHQEFMKEYEEREKKSDEFMENHKKWQEEYEEEKNRGKNPTKSVMNVWIDLKKGLPNLKNMGNCERL